MLFLSLVSGATVALALVAQLDQIGDTFVTFASSVLPALLALGVTSYSRLADLAVHDAYYARAIGRIRSLYLTIEPAAQQYWLQPAGDDAHAVMRQAGQPHSRWHHLGHTATSVAAVVGVIAGALLGVVGSVLTPSALRFLPPARPCSLSLPSVGCWPTRSGAGAEPTVLCSPTSYRRDTLDDRASIRSRRGFGSWPSRVSGSGGCGRGATDPARDRR